MIESYTWKRNDITQYVSYILVNNGKRIDIPNRHTKHYRAAAAVTRLTTRKPKIKFNERIKKTFKKYILH